MPRVHVAVKQSTAWGDSPRRSSASRSLTPPEHGLSSASQGSRPAPLTALPRPAVELSGLGLGSMGPAFFSTPPVRLTAPVHAPRIDPERAQDRERDLPNVVPAPDDRVAPTRHTSTGPTLLGILSEPQAMIALPTGPDRDVPTKGIGIGREHVYRDKHDALTELAHPTWDPNVAVKVAGKVEKGGWVDASPARDTAGTQTNIGTTANPSWVDKRMVTGTPVDPSEDNLMFNLSLCSSEVNEDDLKAATPKQAAQVNPLGPAPKNILQNALHESWHHAKEVLLAPEPEVSKVGRALLMTKLWEFRQWHHDLILRRTQADASIGREGLTEWKAAGSTTLTSDIDVNLKGNKTELAVAVFNRLFKADGWTHEAGVVYDVNVYAEDFMHKDTFKGLAEHKGKVVAHDFAARPEATRVSAKEGKRAGSAGGGIGTESAMLGQRMLEADADLQRVWSLVKLRLYMTARQWHAYRQDASVPAATVSAVDLRYQSYLRDLRAKMNEGKQAVGQADAVSHTGFEVLASVAKRVGKRDGADPEQVKMAASNRLYEAKLVEMAALRGAVQRQIAERQALIEASGAADAEALDAAIDGNLAILRDLISECAMFSNEAYVTDGAINHTVVGLQSKIGISQTRTETLDAFNENVADSLKEIARHSTTIGEAAYKAGKYLWRMADAAKNLGSKDADIENLYAAGFTIANEIKGGDVAQAELERRAGLALQVKLGFRAAKPDALMVFVRLLAARVARAHAAQIAKDRFARTAPVKATR